MGALTALCLDHRGVPLKSTPMDDDHIALQFRLPLSEVGYYHLNFSLIHDCVLIFFVHR